MNKFFVNVISFIFALLIVVIAVYFGKNIILSYYAKPLQDSLQKTISLQNDLESGKIVVFGSSELVLYPNLKFLPQNFFTNDLKVPLRVQGNEGQQTFVIMAQLATYDNEKTRNNARVVILLSPSWFTGGYDNGLTMPKFLEYMYSGMMNKLYFESEANDKYKILISNYVKKNSALIKEPSFIYRYSLDTLEEFYFDDEIKKLIIENFDDKQSPEMVNYNKISLNYENLRMEANKLEFPSTNNPYGINEEYFIKNIQPSMEKGYFPYSIVVPPELNRNQEYQDFLILLDYLKSYKIKPLFVMQDLHPYVFSQNRDEANKLMSLIKEKVLEHNFEYLDMWSYDQKNYEIGNMTDIVHPGELGWLKIDKKIIEYFINKEDK